MTRYVTLVILFAAACGGSPANRDGGKSPVSAAEGPSLTAAPDSGRADHVGPADGALAADGSPDLGFVTRIEGPVTALFIVSVDKDDVPTGAFQADTIVGEGETPKELGTTSGRATSGIGVYEGGALKSEKDGSLSPLGPGTHTLTLWIASSPAISPGTRLRLFVLRPDKSVVGGGTVTR